MIIEDTMFLEKVKLDEANKEENTDDKVPGSLWEHDLSNQTTANLSSHKDEAQTVREEARWLFVPDEYLDKMTQECRDYLKSATKEGNKQWVSEGDVLLAWWAKASPFSTLDKIILNGFGKMVNVALDRADSLLNQFSRDPVPSSRPLHPSQSPRQASRSLRPALSTQRAPHVHPHIPLLVLSRRNTTCPTSFYNPSDCPPRNGSRNHAYACVQDRDVPFDCRSLKGGGALPAWF